MNKNPEEYISSSLNNSTSKYAHSFSKADRFERSKRIQTEAKYTLPNTFNKRTCSFGYGNKSSLIIDRCSPPPGAYQSLSNFDTDKVKLNTPLFGYGREKVMFGSYLQQAQKKGGKVPSPNKYHILTPKNQIGGHIGLRMKTQIQAKKDKHFPGPGAYHLHSIDMANSSSFFLSTLKKSTSPKYHSISTIEIQSKKKRNTSSLFYEVEERSFGKSRSSKFRNAVVSSFGKSKREGPIEKWRQATPGFKYVSFSEFGTSYK